LFLVATTAVTTNPKGYGHIMTEQNIETTEIVDAAPAGTLAVNNFGASNLRHTFPAATFADKVKILDAMTNSVPIVDNLDKPIKLVHVIAKKVTLPNERTGELEDSVRITLVAEDGKSFHATSSALYNSLDDLFGVMGNPSTWNAPLPIKVVKVKANGPGHFFTAKIAL